MFKTLKNFIKDEKGAVTTVEMMGYTVLIGGAVALVGFGATALARGKIGAATNAITDMKAMNEPITESSKYTYTVETDVATGIAVSATE